MTGYDIERSAFAGRFFVKSLPGEGCGWLVLKWQGGEISYALWQNPSLLPLIPCTPLPKEGLNPPG
ncbi:hypothetical protein GCM10028827_10490 [Mucilaginibacter myungsuensis]